MTIVLNSKIPAVVALAAALAVSACGDNEPDNTPTPEPIAETQAAEPAATPDDLRSRLADASRAEADRARDENRKPAEVIDFLGIEPGMKVIDLMAGGGWYTEVLSLAVGTDGEVVAHNTDAALQFRDGANEKAISERLSGNRLPNVTRLNKNIDEITSDDGSFDAAITALNFHDLYNGSGPDAAVEFLRTVYELLEPGGVLGLIDHVGDADADNKNLHRIEKVKTIEAAQEAGFMVEGDSDLLRNGSDDHSRPVFDESVRGKTDRFLLKLGKPPG
jgi:predicted methyltransferase